MRLLDRYLLRELLIPLGYCLGGFLVFWITFDLISTLDDFQRLGLKTGDVVEYYLVKTPEVLVTVLPVALLLGLLYTLTNLARHQELTAMRAAGMGLWRVCAVYIGVGVVFTVGLFGLNELWVPDANEAANRVLGRRTEAAVGTGRGGAGPEWQLGLAFHNEADGRLWNIGAYNRETGAMRGVNLEWWLEGGARRRLAAAEGEYRDGVWVFRGVKELLYPPNETLPSFRGETNELALAELTETPELIRSEIKFTELSNVKAAKRPRLSLRELLDYQRLHPRLKAGDRAKLETQFQGRLAEPWKCLVVVLLAIPFGAPSGRRNLFVGVAASIFIGFGYFVFASVCLALGTGGYVPAWLAGWLPNLLFGAVGIGLTRRVR
jgi:lipopolysaccharide export system permease protein